MAKFLMIAGTASNVGKTLLSACLCEAGRRCGMNIAPFKAQNMSGSTVAQLNGAEVSTAQWFQTGGQTISVHMNPILVKPSARDSSLLVRGDLECDNFMYPGSPRHRNRLKALVLESAEELALRHDLVIIEGAGALAETNLSPFDLSNIWLARALSSKIVLVSDLEHGGALSSVVGTHCLMSEADAAMVVGFMLNRFVGRIGLLKPAISSLERATSWPCLGIVPKLNGSFRFPWEDALCKPIHDVHTSAVLVVDLPFETSGAELSAFALEPTWSLTYAKVPPLVITRQLKLVIVPDCAPSVEAFGVLRMWLPFLMRAKTRGVAVLALGFAFHALSATPRVIANAKGLCLFNVETVMLRSGRPLANCKCTLMGPLTMINGQASVMCRKVGHPSNVLLRSANGIWGTFEGSTFGIGLVSSLLNDDFRRQLMKRSGLVSSITDCQSAIRNALRLAADEVINHFDDRLLSQLIG
ncbi:MAG: AAA family ATPase [Candidatus Hodgkinia cicadicola]